MVIDEWNREPVYRQVAAHLRGQIERGELRPAQRLPGERALEEEYGVSFGTIRHAIKVLRDEGLVVTYHGRGTFVRPPDMQPD